MIGCRVSGIGYRARAGEAEADLILPLHIPTRHPLPVTRYLLTAMTLVIVASGCSNVQPWVKPYERAAFADPIMAANPNPVSGSYINHVREAREGARGATGVAGGGCGCN